MGFLRTKIGRLFGSVGTGAEAIAYAPSGKLSPLVDGFNTSRYAVRGQIDAQAPAYVKQGQQFVPVSIIGNGTTLQGQMALQRLSKLMEDG